MQLIFRKYFTEFKLKFFYFFINYSKFKFNKIIFIIFLNFKIIKVYNNIHFNGLNIDPYLDYALNNIISKNI